MVDDTYSSTTWESEAGDLLISSRPTQEGTQVSLCITSSGEMKSFFVLFYFDLDFLRQGLYVALAVLELDM